MQKTNQSGFINIPIISGTNFKEVQTQTKLVQLSPVSLLVKLHLNFQKNSKDRLIKKRKDDGGGAEVSKGKQGCKLVTFKVNERIFLLATNIWIINISVYKIYISDCLKPFLDQNA